MSSKQEIAQILRDIVFKGKKNIDNIIMCSVVSVDGITCVCQPIDEGEAEIPDVRLAAAEHDTNIIIIPTEGSTVGVLAFSDLETCEYTVVMYSQIDTVLIRGDQFGGLTKTPELKAQLDKNNEILQAILDILTGSPINEPGNGSPSALQAALSGALAGKMVGDFSDIENENVKHG